MIEHYLAQFGDYLGAHPYIGLLSAFLIAFAESLPILGTVIPGSVTMTLIGILVGRNTLSLPLTIILATIGALFGDAIGFWIGKHFNDRLKNIWPFRKHPKFLAMGEKFFKKHGGKSIIIGRFIGPTRSSVPLFAGLLKMRWRNFLIAAIPSAFLWAIAYLLPGILIGAISLTLPKGQVTKFLLIGLAIIVLLWVIVWAIQRFFVFLAGCINQGIDRSWDWLNRHHSSKFLIKLITNQKKPEDHHQLTMLILASFFIILFLIVFAAVIFKNGLYHLNDPTFQFLQSIRTDGLNNFFAIITEFGDKTVLAIATGLMFIYFALRRQWTLCLHLLAIIIASYGAVWVFKHVFYHPRPAGFMVTVKSSSFPSGHSTISLAILGFCSYLIAQTLNKRWHWIPYTLGALLITIICFSRLYLGAHWLCDVIAGVLIGAVILLLTIVSYRRSIPILSKPIQTIAIILLAIIIPAIASVDMYYRFNLYRFTPYYPTKTISIQSWWDEPQQALPIYRLNRFGHAIQPFNVQWASELSTIKKTLQVHGWRVEHKKENLQTALQRFTSTKPEQHIAFLNQLYLGKPPVLFVIKKLQKSNRIIELRLWKTGVHFDDSDLPLFIGSSNFHTSAKSLLNLEPRKQITLTHGGGLNQLEKSLKQKFIIKKIELKDELIPKHVESLDWDKTLMVIK